MKEKKIVKEEDTSIEEGFSKEAIMMLCRNGGIHKFKSINRALRRGHLSIDGYIYPSRPFNNRANTSSRTGVASRKENEQKKLIYNEFVKLYGKRVVR